MDFKRATDRATAPSITLADIARACGVSENTIRRARMSPGGGNYRSPPQGWEHALAALARERARELLALARELMALAQELEPDE